MNDLENKAGRELRLDQLKADVVVVGGGLAGVCAAVTAARAGANTILLQDRPVLGGNASSEVRLWILGATSHMGNNNRWAREGGLVDELLVENMYRNPEGNPLILDTIILAKVTNEPRLTLLLNTAVSEVEKINDCTIRLVRAFCSQNATRYEISAPIFVDASGDGVVGFLAGAAFRMGTEARAELGEKFAPAEASRELLGHTIYFYSKNTGRPVKFTPPAFALRDISKIPRWRDIQFKEDGCRLWWLEWGGRLDTIHDSEKIKWELWRVAYGVWHYIKNSGKFPEAETATLEWVGTIPGKRESRRFEGDHLLTQHDIVEQRQHPDAVAFGGWAIDLHPADGVYSSQPGCQQWHAKGVYQIPYRSLYSRNIDNLFLAGRLISVSHIAFGSTRVMATCGHAGQAAGLAAATCAREQCRPRDLLAPRRMAALQNALLLTGQHIPGLALTDAADLARRATLTASSELKLSRLIPCGETLNLAQSWAMLLPITPGRMPQVEFLVNVSAVTTLRVELRASQRPDNHTPEVILAVKTYDLEPGAEIKLPVQFDYRIDEARYVFVCLLKNEAVAVHLSNQRVTGILAVCHNGNKAVAKSATQMPPPDSGLDTFEFWTPQRRPGGRNLAVRVDPPLDVFRVGNLINGIDRPTRQPNAWVAGFDQQQPALRLTWTTSQRIARLELCFDTDFDHPMESVLMGHPENVMPFCVRRVILVQPSQGLAGQSDGLAGEPSAQVLWELAENHQTRLCLRLPEPLVTDQLELRFEAPGDTIPVALFAIRCYGTD
ncbi:MAG TPA: FAD-dependent oxidoreductase [Verrucomicrobiae bacterium]